MGETVPEDPFRPQLGEPHHHAYVVEDIEATAKRLVDELGAGPFFLIERVPLEKVLSRGEPRFVHNSAFGACARGMIKAVLPVSLAPGRVEEVLRLPAENHRIAYVVPATEVADLRRSLDERGLSQYLSSQFGGGTEASTTPPPPWADIEIHADNEGLREFFRMVHGAAHAGTARNRSAGSRSDLLGSREHGAPETVPPVPPGSGDSVAGPAACRAVSALGKSSARMILPSRNPYR